MNDNEIPRLIEWLKEHGHNDSEIVECIYFVTKGKIQKDHESNEKQE